MRHVFLSSGQPPRPRWLAAFPGLEVIPDVPGPGSADPGAIYWLACDGGAGDAEAQLVRLVDLGLRVVVLSPVPGEPEAFRMLSLGARGYCHVEAVPEQLRDVAEVVAADGLWMPPALVQRLVGLAQRLEKDAPRRTYPALEDLTHREEEVAVLVGRGFSNREIAEQLGISERTVKANLTAIFDKLALRDRVQLALYVNRLPIH